MIYIRYAKTGLAPSEGHSVTLTVETQEMGGSSTCIGVRYTFATLARTPQLLSMLWPTANPTGADDAYVEYLV